MKNFQFLSINLFSLMNSFTLMILIMLFSLIPNEIRESCVMEANRSDNEYCEIVNKWLICSYFKLQIKHLTNNACSPYAEQNKKNLL